MQAWAPTAGPSGSSTAREARSADSRFMAMTSRSCRLPRRRSPQARRHRGSSSSRTTPPAKSCEPRAIRLLARALRGHPATPRPARFSSTASHWSTGEMSGTASGLRPFWGSGPPQPRTKSGRLSGRVRSGLIHRSAIWGASLLIVCPCAFAVLSHAEATALARSVARALPSAYPKQESRHRRRVVRSQALPSLRRLTIRASLARVGYVGVRITGPVGAQVQLSEQLAHGTRPLAVVGLPAGAANVPMALTWRCDRRDRHLIASTMPPAASEQASTAATTPSCAQRLATTIQRRAPVGGELTIRLRDRWGIGGLALTICTTPPGGLRHCRPWFLHTGQRHRVIHVATPRPGGWRVRVETLRRSRGPARLAAVSGCWPPATRRCSCSMASSDRTFARVASA
jgi:hypothetical protein